MQVFLLVRRRATLPGPGWVQVPSLLKGLTAVFEMGTGVTPSLEPPASRCNKVTKQGQRARKFKKQKAKFKMQVLLSQYYQYPEGIPTFCFLNLEF